MSGFFKLFSQAHSKQESQGSEVPPAFDERQFQQLKGAVQSCSDGLRFAISTYFEDERAVAYQLDLIEDGKAFSKITGITAQHAREANSYGKALIAELKKLLDPRASESQISSWLLNLKDYKNEAQDFSQNASGFASEFRNLAASVSSKSDLLKRLIEKFNKEVQDLKTRLTRHQKNERDAKICAAVFAGLLVICIIAIPVGAAVAGPAIGAKVLGGAAFSAKVAGTKGAVVSQAVGLAGKAGIAPTGLFATLAGATLLFSILALQDVETHQNRLLRTCKEMEKVTKELENVEQSIGIFTHFWLQTVTDLEGILKLYNKAGNRNQARRHTENLKQRWEELARGYESYAQAVPSKIDIGWDQIAAKITEGENERLQAIAQQLQKQKEYRHMTVEKVTEIIPGIILDQLNPSQI